MTPLEVLQLIGYSNAAALHLWIGAMLVRRRRTVGIIERVLTLLAFAIGVWHASNLFVALHGMLGFAPGTWTAVLRTADTFAVVSVTLTYSLLLHVHLDLWAKARSRPLNRTERIRVYLSYIPVAFLAYAVTKIWIGPYAPMFEKLSNLLLPFSLWAAYVLMLVAVTDFLIAHQSKSLSERRLMRTLGASFVGIASLILIVYAAGFGEGTVTGQFLKTLANLGSLVPTALLAYHIYRYRYLELIFKESLVIASFAIVILVVYLYGLRTIAEWATARFGLRAAAIESILILALALIASPFRRWLESRFRELFEQEASLYREVATRISSYSGRYKHLPELLKFVEEHTAERLGLRKVRLIPVIEQTLPSDITQHTSGVRSEASEGRVWDRKNGAPGSINGAEKGKTERAQESIVSAALSSQRERRMPLSESDADWANDILQRSSALGWESVDNDAGLASEQFDLAIPLKRENRVVGLMLVDAAEDALTYDVRAMLEMLASQVATAIEDCKLVEENVRLERRVAQGERLSALGQMAATVAHEVKNPLSAIKSIAQVMREDEHIKGEYARDLDLIVGEADRLSRSVTQMLSFARVAPETESMHDADSLVRGIVRLFSADADARQISLEVDLDFGGNQIDGASAAALRDALSNLLVNALQASPEAGRVAVEGRNVDQRLIISVEDSGAGIDPDKRDQIWEPFFTTKLRGTGLGLAIVRKRIEEVGGTARLVNTSNGSGARFELVIRGVAGAPQ